MCYQVFIWTVDDVIKFEIYLRSTSKVMGDRGKKGEDGNTKSEYLENENSFLDEIKNFFRGFWRAII